MEIYHLKKQVLEYEQKPKLNSLEDLNENNNSLLAVSNGGSSKRLGSSKSARNLMSDREIMVDE